MNYKKFIYIFQLFLNLVLICSFTSVSENASAAIPYESCNLEKNKISNDLSDFHSETQKLAEARYCYECDAYSESFKFIKTTSKNLDSFTSAQQNKEIPKMCFLLSKLRGVQASPKADSYYYCGKLNKGDELLDKSPVLGEKTVRSPCLNEKYIDMTSKAFNKMTKCFQFNQTDKESVFQLINHESGFILNAKSPSKARCYGQVTMGAINDVLRNVKNGNEIYNRFNRKCPTLGYPVDIKKLTELSKISVDGSLSPRQQYNTAAKYITCQVTNNPYSCLFYTLFYYKINLKIATKKIKKDDEKITAQILKKDPELVKFYKKNPQIKPPVNATEVIIVEGVGTSKKTNNKLTIKWIFNNSISAHASLKKN